MAASITIDTTGVPISGSTWSTGDYENITIGGKTLKELGAADSTTDTITVPGYGSFKLTDSLGSVTFTAAAGMPAGAYIFTPIATESGETGLSYPALQACITIADLSAMTGAFTLADLGTNQKNTTLTKLITGSGTDIVRGSRYTALKQISTGAGEDAVIAKAAADLKVNTGDGNDSLLLTGAATLSSAIVLGSGDDTIGVGDASATVYGGAGADVFIASNEAAAITVGDYKYSENDVIIPFYKGSISLDKEGKFSSTGVSAQLTAENGVYRAKFYQAAEVSQTLSDTTGSLANCEYWTAADSNASGIDLVNMDASGVTMAYDIDAGAAASANITLGSNGGNGGSVTLAAGASTLTTAKAGGSVAVKDFGSDDVLHLAGTFTLDGKNIESMGTTLTGILSNTATEIITYTENGATEKKTIGIMGSTSEKNIVLTTATGVLDKYVGRRTANMYGIDASALTTAQSFRLNNDEGVEDKYQGVYYVKSGAAGGTFVGANEGIAVTSPNGDTYMPQTYFDLQQATVGSQLWAGGTKNVMHASLDEVTLAADTVWVGTTEKGSYIDGFSTGFADTSDIIYLYETADVNNAELYKEARYISMQASSQAAGTVTLTDKSVAEASGAQLKIEDASKTIRKVAYGLKATTGIQAVDTVGGIAVADYVISKAANGKVLYSSAEAGQSYNVRLNNDAMATTKYTDITQADMSGVAADAKMTVVGANRSVAGTTNAFTLAGAQTDFWGGGSQADAVQLSTAAGAANTVWFGQTDGLDVVTKADAAGTTDTAYFYDEASLGDLMKDYTVTVDPTTNHTVTFKHDDSNALTLTGDAALSSFYVKTQAGLVKAVASNTMAKNVLNYAADTHLYLGNGNVDISPRIATTLNVSGDQGASIRMNNDDGKNYYQGILTVDASGVTAGNVVLVGPGKGRGDKDVMGAVLIGGYGSQNDYWGGSKGCDVFGGRDGITDVVWFGAGDGEDVFSSAGKEDKVYLYNTASIADLKVMGGTLNGSEVLGISVVDGDQLDIHSTSGKISGSDGITVGLKDGSGYYVSQASDGKYGFVKKA